MGREIKRVPVDFNWPIGKIFYGYHIQSCLSKENYTGCEECRAWAKIKKLDIKKYGCPNFEPLLGPPKGNGYQLWETTSEGSPMSPVFSSPEELAVWLEYNKISSFGTMTRSYDQWLDFIKGPGWAPCLCFKKGDLK